MCLFSEALGNVKAEFEKRERHSTTSQEFENKCPLIKVLIHSASPPLRN